MSTGAVWGCGEDDGFLLVEPDVAAAEVSEAQVLADMRDAQVLHGREYARDLESIARLASRRRRRGELVTASGRGGPGAGSRAVADAVLAGVAEDFVAELALSRVCSEAEAGMLLREALLLTGPLSPTWSYLFDGLIGVRHAKAVVDLLADATVEVAAAVQARVLPRAVGSTASEFRDRLRRTLYRVDSEARERRRREALTRLGVSVRRVDEGVSELVVQAATPMAHAGYDVVDTLARMRRADGDGRPLGVLRAETAMDLLLRPWDDTRPPVTAQLVLHASAPALRPAGDPSRTSTPGELDGQVVSAAECRDLLHELGMIGLGDPPAGGSILIAVDEPTTGETIAVATRSELRRAARGTGLRPPRDTGGYRPTAAQRRHVVVRDRRCRMPGCRRRPGRCDLDHNDPYEEGGSTACPNLCCLCRHHHRIKTLAPGWSFRLVDRTLVVRTPAGVTRHTRPPGWCHDPEPDPPWLDERAPPDPLRT